MRQRRFWSACANAQADLNLCWAHMSKGTFSDVALRWIFRFWSSQFWQEDNYPLFEDLAWYHNFLERSACAARSTNCNVMDKMSSHFHTCSKKYLLKDTFGQAMRKRVFGHMRTAKAQISLRIRAVWSGSSLSVNKIIEYYKMCERRTKARMIRCICAGWSEPVHFAHVWRHVFTWHGLVDIRTSKAILLL